MDASLGRLGLTLPQFVALSGIAGNVGISNAELARQAFVTPQTMHRIVNGLEKRGCLVRRPHPQLERIQRLFLTKCGEKLLDEASGVVDKIEYQSLRGFSDREVNEFGTMLQKYLEAMEDIC